MNFGKYLPLLKCFQVELIMGYNNVVCINSEVT